MGLCQGRRVNGGHPVRDRELLLALLGLFEVLAEELSLLGPADLGPSSPGLLLAGLSSPSSPGLLGEQPLVVGCFAGLRLDLADLREDLCDRAAL